MMADELTTDQCREIAVKVYRSIVDYTDSPADQMFITQCICTLMIHWASATSGQSKEVLTDTLYRLLKKNL